MNKDLKKSLSKLLSDPDFKIALEKDNWDYVIKTVRDEVLRPEYQGEFIDYLVKSNINFCPFLTEAPDRGFYASTLLKEADLRNCTKLGGRCFRKSHIEKIWLSKDNLKDIDVGILSMVPNNVTIIWDGKYSDFFKLRRNSNAWYNYTGTITIKCTDGDFTEDHSYN